MKQQQQGILLIGSTGYLGRTLTKHLQRANHVIPTHRTKARFDGSQHYDFWTDDVQALIQQYQIDTIVVAANMAYSPTSDFALFQQRVKQLIQGCQQYRVIYISSDGIFGGEKGNYIESDIPTPITPYGRNLQYFEQMVQSLCSNYCIIRPSYLYGYSLSQLDPRLTAAQTRLLAGERLTYFADMIKSPMEVNQAAEAITLLTCSQYVGIVHVAGKAMSIYDFYREAMNSLKIPSTRLYPAQMPANSPHPRNTSLDINLMKKLTKIVPLSVYVALAQTEGSAL
ncbi:NAD(P)-dependent oxidoreductase [Reticulibacter mediterranei]|uniref:NAD(P)-dependent oxidoreductase n=1 Tax=Reticulibacter mediterranei TaxID=2778369 RepID=A0A8J3N026_9CHLR|nr:sugar nucleotide-binding protein [Reticulibacter mediterranei]GHO91058.1 NAD(P)-dependent oxidoreductase [Reticulibacter mediterranei]